MDLDNLICEHADLKLRSVQRIKAEEKKRYNELALLALCSKVNFKATDLMSFYEAGLDSTLISANINAANSIRMGNEILSDGISYDKSFEQFKNIVEELNKFYKQYTVDDRNIVLKAHKYKDDGIMEIRAYSISSFRYDISRILAIPIFENFLNNVIYIPDFSDLQDFVDNAFSDAGIDIKKTVADETEVTFKYEWTVNDNYEHVSEKILMRGVDGDYGEFTYRYNGSMKSDYIINGKLYNSPESSNDMLETRALIETISDERTREQLLKQNEWLAGLFKINEYNGGDYEIVQADINSGTGMEPDMYRYEIGQEMLMYFDNLYRALCPKICFNMSSASVCVSLDNTVFGRYVNSASVLKKSGKFVNVKLLPKYRKVTKNGEGMTDVTVSVKCDKRNS